MAFGLLYDYLMGQTIDAYTYFGAHFETRDKQKGVVFRLYAPGASDVSVIGEWNDWNPTKDKLKKIDDAGVWELFIPGLKDYQNYKFQIFYWENGKIFRDYFEDNQLRTQEFIYIHLFRRPNFKVNFDIDNTDLKTY